MIRLPRLFPNPGGVPAISRGLSESTSDTPGHGTKTKRTPEGCQPSVRLPATLRPVPGRAVSPAFSAQPPATRCHPSGMRPAATAAVHFLEGNR